MICGRAEEENTLQVKVDENVRKKTEHYICSLCEHLVENEAINKLKPPKPI